MKSRRRLCACAALWHRLRPAVRAELGAALAGVWSWLRATPCGQSWRCSRTSRRSRVLGSRRIRSGATRSNRSTLCCGRSATVTDTSSPGCSAVSGQGRNQGAVIRISACTLSAARRADRGSQSDVQAAMPDSQATAAGSSEVVRVDTSCRGTGGLQGAAGQRQGGVPVGGSGVERARRNGVVAAGLQRDAGRGCGEVGVGVRADGGIDQRHAAVRGDGQDLENAARPKDASAASDGSAGRHQARVPDRLGAGGARQPGVWSVCRGGDTHEGH